MADMVDTTTDVIANVPRQLFIRGQWVAAADGRTFGVENPATETQLCEIADGGAADSARAVEASVAAQDSWARTAPRVRSEILRRTHELILERTDELALLMTLEMGKPLAEARGEVAYAAEFFRWFSEEAVRIDGGMTTTPDGRNRIMVMRQPVGPCVLITPWNFPLAMGTRKIGPAVAAGCTMDLWNSATWENSEALLPYLDVVLQGPDGWDTDDTIRRAIEIRRGVVQNPKVLAFQHRTAKYPHAHREPQTASRP